MLRCPEARAGGLARLSEDVYARSTRRSQEARIATLVKLAAAAAIALVPATVESISLLAGALKAGSYRSGAGYLGALARVHKRAGHCWTPDLEIARTDAVRSLERGLGPAKRARVVDLETVVGHHGDTGGTQQGDIDFVTIGALWMLRGAEAAALLRDQVTVSEDTSHASIVLGAFKTNPTGRECTRTLRCSCGRTSASGEVEGVDIGRSTCPVHALVRVIERRGGLGATDKHPFFCGRNLAALTPGSARLAICRACRCVGMSEHSMRRMGAQYYARRGVLLATIQHIGRWGSATVLLYVEQALEGRASWAPVVAAVGFGDEGVAIAGGGQLRGVPPCWPLPAEQAALGAGASAIACAHCAGCTWCGWRRGSRFCGTCVPWGRPEWTGADCPRLRVAAWVGPWARGGALGRSGTGGSLPTVRGPRGGRLGGACAGRDQVGRHGRGPPGPAGVLRGAPLHLGYPVRVAVWNRSARALLRVWDHLQALPVGRFESVGSGGGRGGRSIVWNPLRPSRTRAGGGAVDPVLGTRSAPRGLGARPDSWQL